MPCFCFLYNVVEKVVKTTTGMKTPYEARFQEPFLDRDLLQFGCEVEYLPANPKYVEKQHTLGSKMRSGIFFRGGNGVVTFGLQTGRKWKLQYIRLTLNLPEYRVETLKYLN